MSMRRDVQSAINGQTNSDRLAQRWLLNSTLWMPGPMYCVPHWILRNLISAGNSMKALAPGKSLLTDVSIEEVHQSNERDSGYDRVPLLEVMTTDSSTMQPRALWLDLSRWMKLPVVFPIRTRPKPSHEALGEEGPFRCLHSNAVQSAHASDRQ